MEDLEKVAESDRNGLKVDLIVKDDNSLMNRNKSGLIIARDRIESDDLGSLGDDSQMTERNEGDRRRSIVNEVDDLRAKFLSVSAELDEVKKEKTEKEDELRKMIEQLEEGSLGSSKST